MVVELLKRASVFFAGGERAPKIGRGFRLVQELAAGGFDVAVASRVVKITVGLLRMADPTAPSRDVEDAYLANTILDIHSRSRCSHGAPRVHAELRLGMGVRVGRKRVARLLRLVGRRGIAHRHKRRPRPEPAGSGSHQPSHQPNATTKQRRRQDPLSRRRLTLPLDRPYISVGFLPQQHCDRGNLAVGQRRRLR